MFLRQIHDYLQPRRCIFCNVRCASHEDFICIPCAEDLPWHEHLQAPDIEPMNLVAAPLDYAFPVDAALKLLKFRRRLDYAPGLAEVLLRAFEELDLDVDAVLPMPLHWRRQAIRGYNQAWELSRNIRKQTGLPVLRNVRRVRHTPSQSGLDEAARKRNLRDAFAVRQSIAADHVLIIDDVITTGESCRQLANTLLAAGAVKVSALAVART